MLLDGVLVAWKGYKAVRTVRGLRTEYQRIKAVTWQRGKRLDADWLRPQLAALGFDSRDEQRDTYLINCLWNLNLQGMFREGQAIEFFADSPTRDELKAMYEPAGSQLERAEQGARLDADGYTWWGPMLHRAHPEVRDDMRNTIAEALRRSAERQRLANRKQWT